MTRCFCGREVPPSRTRPRLYCRQACAKLAVAMRRNASRAVRLRAVHESFAQLYADATPGRCALCDGRLPPSRTKPRRVCDSTDCRRLYFRLYREAQSRAEGRTPREVAP